MSLVFPSREVAAGPTLGIKGQGAPSVAEAASVTGVPLYMRVSAGDKWRVQGGKEEVGKGGAVAGRNGFGLGGRKGGCMAAAGVEREKGADSSDSSSIGEGEESSLSLSSSTGDDQGDGEEEVQSTLKEDALGSLESLEESLPVKRGLSNCFSGKSKSFASLSDAAALGSARDLAKAENPFNKRRRILMACKASWQRRASYAALNSSPNLWALEEDEEYHGDDGKHGGGGGAGVEVPKLPQPSPLSMGRKHIKAFRTPRSFSLTDLQHA